MANLAAALRSEIARLARKETRTHVEPLRKAVATQRKEIAGLKRQVALLSRQPWTSGRKAKTDATVSANTGKSRFSAKGVKALRQRLGLSASRFGTLAGASGQSVYNWEAGKTVPRDAQRKALAGLRSLGKKEARARIAGLN